MRDPVGREQMAIKRDSTLVRLLTLLASFAVTTQLGAQGNVIIKAARLPDFAAWLLTSDEVTQRDINPPKSVDSDIYLIRLYQVPRIGGCEGTDETCVNRCALLLFTGGMPGGRALYDLGTVGQIVDIQWVSSPRRRIVATNPTVLAAATEATLLMTVQNYPAWAVREHSFKPQIARYHLVANMDSIAVTPLP